MGVSPGAEELDDVGDVADDAEDGSLLDILSDLS